MWWWETRYTHWAEEINTLCNMRLCQAGEIPNAIMSNAKFGNEL